MIYRWGGGGLGCGEATTCKPSHAQPIQNKTSTEICEGEKEGYGMKRMMIFLEM